MKNLNDVTLFGVVIGAVFLFLGHVLAFIGFLLLGVIFLLNFAFRHYD